MEKVKKEVEKKIKVPKFETPSVVDNLTKENIKDIIFSQENAIYQLENEIEKKKECIKYYKGFIKEHN